MALEAIIIRADGALAETEDLRRMAFEQVFAEAGFAWNFSRDAFAQSQRQGTARARMAYFVHQALKGKRETPDLSPLIDAMHRRCCKLFTGFIQSQPIEPRAGVRDLVTAAHQEQLRLAVTALLPEVEIDALLRKTLGSWSASAFTTIAPDRNVADDGDAANLALYQRVREAIDIDPVNCLVIEATVSGANGARAAGYAVVTTRSAFCAQGGEGAQGPVFEDLPSLMTLSDGGWTDAVTADERTELIATLQQLHASNFATLANPNGSDTMRVCDILKVKGSDVKTIESGATIRALADGLKAERVGAMVVLDPSRSVVGIISERDLARGLAEFGADLPRIKVADLMTRSVVTCVPEDSVAAVAKVMTVRRIRHLPVVVDGALIGLVSIGDVLKHRLDEVQLEANVLREFALARK